MVDSYGARIKAARKQAGLKQKELAEKLGMSPGGVGRWENDFRTPTVKTLTKIANVIGCDLADLLPDEAQRVQTNNVYWERINAIAARQRAKGISKYGVGLENNPAAILERINHLQEELIDGLMYCEWIKDRLKELEG